MKNLKETFTYNVNRLTGITWSGGFSGTPMFDRGYTLHEHYDGFDLINMKFTLSERSAKLCLSTAKRCELGGANGRLYDPILGRMLSPDIVVQDEQNSQAYNRYSYCFNNPLRYTDPSGYVVRGSRNYFDWNSMVYYVFGNYRSNGSAFNTELSEGKAIPVHDNFTVDDEGYIKLVEKTNDNFDVIYTKDSWDKGKKTITLLLTKMF